MLQICIGSICLVLATPPTVLGQSFWNFTGTLQLSFDFTWEICHLLDITAVAGHLAWLAVLLTCAARKRHETKKHYLCKMCQYHHFSPNFRTARTKYCLLNLQRNNEFNCTLTTIIFLSFRTDRSGQTVQTQIRLLLEEQSDQGLHCLLFPMHLLDALL